jgi:hypothetical protein
MESEKGKGAKKSTKENKENDLINAGLVIRRRAMETLLIPFFFLLVGILNEIFKVVLDHLEWLYLMGLVVTSKMTLHSFKSVKI